MQLYIVDSPIGIFALNDAGEIVGKSLFKGGSAEAAKLVAKINKGEAPKEVTNFLRGLAKRRKFKKLIFDNPKLAGALEGRIAAEIHVQRPCPAASKFRRKLASTALKLKVFKSEVEFEDFVRDVSLQLASLSVREAAAKRDAFAIQAARALDDLDKTLNLFSGRIREWYGLIFPELNGLIESHEAYLKLVAKLGEKSNFALNALLKRGVPADKAKLIAQSAVKSMGAKPSDADVAPIRDFCALGLELFALRKRVEAYLVELMNDVAPNLTALIGPTLSAKLISLAGGLESLARMPASTIQVLGAEKALFRALRTGTRPPKHGLIFQHALLHQSPRWQRGKIARALAGKLAIAARLDAFEGEFKGEELRRELEERAKEIREKYRRPPRRRRAKRKG